MAKFNIPITDYSNENSAAAIPVADAVIDGDLTTVFNAIDGVALGNIGQAALNISAAKNAGPGGTPTNKFAQRELKWLVRYHDATTLKNRTLEIPTADAALLTGNTDFMDLADAGAGQALKEGLDGTMKDPETGNVVVVDSVQLVGRNI